MKKVLSYTFVFIMVISFSAFGLSGVGHACDECDPDDGCSIGLPQPTPPAGNQQPTQSPAPTQPPVISPQPTQAPVVTPQPTLPAGNQAQPTPPAGNQAQPTLPAGNQAQPTPPAQNQPTPTPPAQNQGQGSASVTPTVQINDPSLAQWARDGVTRAVAAGVVPQALQSLFGQEITRAEFSALIVAVFEAYTGEEIQQRRTFSDTTDANVEKLAGLGIVNGVGGDRFDPNASLNRQMAAVITVNLFDALEIYLPKESATFADIGVIANWAREAVGQVQAAEIMLGTGDKRFDPLQVFSRQQAIVVLMRLCDFVEPMLGSLEDAIQAANNR